MSQNNAKYKGEATVLTQSNDYLIFIEVSCTFRDVYILFACVLASKTDIEYESE